jgi:F-type H+-transporting ATPase subunit b
METLLHDTTIWLWFSFLIFLGVIWHFGRSMITAALDGRIEKIRHDIDSVTKLRAEAQDTLTSYTSKLKDSQIESDKLLAAAAHNAQKIREQAEYDLNELLTRKEHQLKDRIDRMKQAALQDIQNATTDLAIKAASEIISKRLDSASDHILVKNSLSDVQRAIVG